jgi:signal transduction histidine kinase/CheY-like chemotaxis protein/FixJ family two-component response regulator
VDRKLFVALISQDPVFAGSLQKAIRESLESVQISYFESEVSFDPGFSDLKTDIIISDHRNKHSDWKAFLSDILNSDSNLLVIFIVEDSERGRSVEMIKAGAYDVLTPDAFSRIQPLLHRILRDLDEKANLRYLSDEKDYSDHIVNNSRSMLSIINRNYIYEKVNTTFCSAHTIEIKSIIGKSLREIWGDETFENKIKKNIDLCFLGNTVRYEANFDTPLFGNKFFEVVFRPITKDSGEITHLLAETFDITDLRLSQQIVNDMEEEFKRLETNLPIGFLRCDMNGSIIHANRAYLKIMECDDEALIKGLGISEFYTEKGLFEIHLSQLINAEIKTFGRVTLYTCNGNEIACRISGFIVTNESGNPSFIDFAFEDSSRELMLENRLLQAQKLETIGALAGGLAHDFNNILATIFGYSEMLLEEIPKDNPSAEKLNRIIAAITKARSLTDQILTFSRQVDQEKIPVSVVEVLKETIGFIKSGAPHNIFINEEILSTDIQVHADPTQLFRVFLNLMTNAIQSMEPRGGTISVKLAVVDGNLVRHDLNKNIVADEYAIITIEDSGEGMDPSVIQRIFEPYFTTREIGKGTGLGLSVVHGIIAEMEGEIIVSSKKSSGSVFSVYLPVSSGYHSIETNREGYNKLLFISGNRYESRILSIALENSGYELVFASDLNRLLLLLQEKNNPPVLIIYMDDSEEIRPGDLINIYSSKKINTPLILISDRNHLQSTEKLVNSGMVKQQLTKPVSLREIHGAIQTALK